MKRSYLITTEHLEKLLWFRSNEDYKVGMNYVAIQAALQPNVTVLGFVLMSNHVHFVIKGVSDDIVAFINQFKTRYAGYVWHNYGINELLKRNKLNVKVVDPNEDESMERVLAYVQMNPVAANICSQPTQYPWGTGNTFFNADIPVAKRIGNFSKNALRKIIHSESDCLPKEWLMSVSGYILPQSFVDVLTVESCFRSPKRMNYFNYNSSKARKRIEASEDCLPSFRDESILIAIPDLCRTLFHKKSFDNLNSQEQPELLRQLKFRFSADVGQLAWVCGLTYSETARLLDSE